MFVKGKRTTTDYVQIDVRPDEVFTALVEHIWEGRRPPQAQYINGEGVWESWEALHGSGLTNTYGTASGADQLLQEALKKVQEALRLRDRK